MTTTTCWTPPRRSCPPSDDAVDLNTTFVDALQSRQKEEEEVVIGNFFKVYYCL